MHTITRAGNPRRDTTLRDSNVAICAPPGAALEI